HDPAPTPLYTLSLHDALPISVRRNDAALVLQRRHAPVRPVLAVLQDVAAPPGDMRLVLRGHAVHGFGNRPPRLLRARRNAQRRGDRKSTRLNSSHEWISYAVF